MEEKRCYGCMKIKSGESVCEHCGYDEAIKNETHQLPAGTILKEQYLIGKVLGQGGFGITYLGWDIYLDIPVAIKEYFPNRTVMRDVSVSTEVVSYSGDAGVRFRNNKERFMREAKMLARFSQVPEIVQVRNFFLANNTAYIVMEYVEGINLKQEVKNNGGTLSYERTFEIVKPIIEALCKVHKAGLVHRDISPDNIMLLPDGTAKLLDFGAVRDVGEADVDTPLTQSTEAILKQGYAPIEQYQNRGSLGPWTDVYALCATIYYCLTGIVPNDAPGRLLDDEDISFEGLGLEQQVVKVLHQGMALRAADRVRSMDELLERLETKEMPTPEPLAEEPTVLQKEEPVKKVVHQKNQISEGTKLFLIMLIIIAVGLVVIIFTQSSKPVETQVGENQNVVENLKIHQGKCGEEVSYLFDPESGVLTLTGTGDMYDYNGTWQLDDPEGAPPDPSRETAPWVEFKEEILSVYIGDGITSIGDNAFEQCWNLGDVRIGKDVKRIGDQAFLASSLSEVVLPEGLEELTECAFNYCESLEKVFLPESLKNLKPWVFNECKSLNTVILGDDTQLDAEAIHCENHEDQSCLSNVVLYVTPGSNAEKSAQEHGYTYKEKAAGWCGVTVSWYLDLEEKCLYLLGYGATGVFNIGDHPDGNWEDYTAREWITNERPGWYSMYSNKIEKIVVGSYINELNFRLFTDLIYLKEIDFGGAEFVSSLLYGCRALEEITAPSTLKNISSEAFADCQNLRKIEILSDEAVLREGAFAYNYNLEEVYFSRGAVIDDSAGDLFNVMYGYEVSPKVTFYVYEGSDAERYAKKYDIPYEILEDPALAVTEDGDWLSGQCGDDIRWTFHRGTHTLRLEGTGETWLYHISEESRADWEQEFSAYQITSGAPGWQDEEVYHIEIGEGITHLNHGIFQHMPHLRNVDFGPTVEAVNFTFQWSGLEEITFPENVKVVGTFALLWNSCLERVTFECDDVEIRWGALAACENLKEVYFPRNAVFTDDIIDPDGNDPISEELTFYVYEGSKAHEGAKWYADRYGIKLAFREN